MLSDSSHIPSFGVSQYEDQIQKFKDYLLQIETPKESLELIIKQLNLSLLNEVKLMVKPEKYIIEGIQAIVTIFVGTEQWLPPNPEAVDWNSIKYALQNSSRFIHFLQNYKNKTISPDAIKQAKSLISQHLLNSQLDNKKVSKKLLSFSQLTTKIAISLINYYEKYFIEEEFSPIRSEDSQPNIRPQRIQDSFKDLLSNIELSNSKSTKSTSAPKKRPFTPDHSVDPDKEKLKLRSQIDHHKQLMRQFQEEESQLKWQIEREAKQIAKLEQEKKNKQEIYWSSLQHRKNQLYESEQQKLKQEEKEKLREFKRSLTPSKSSSRQNELTDDQTLKNLRYQARLQEQQLKLKESTVKKLQDSTMRPQKKIIK